MARLNSRTIGTAGLAMAVLMASAASVLPAVVVWGLLPAIIASALLAVSVHAISRHSSATQVLLGIPPIALSAMSLWALKAVFLDGAWPTYLPYYAIALAMPLVMIQSYLARPK